MIPIPAVDMSEGRAVRLQQGRFDRVTHFDDDPLQAVARWIDAGAERVHLVDLDAARTGQPENATLIERAVRRWPQVAFQVGGGIRDMDALHRWLQAGVRYPVLGTAAVRHPDFAERAAELYPDRVILALDTRQGRVATQGWTEDSDLELLDLAQRYAELPLAAILHTDIGRDGTLAGPNLQASAELAAAQPHAVLVSGGVRHLDDLLAIQQAGVFAGAICGRALYEGHLDLAEAFRRCRVADGGAGA